MSEQKAAYRQIMKATSIFGGVQIIQIIVQIARSKAIAVLLGPAGMGINSLLNSTILLVQSLSNFGLKTSAVKNVAEESMTGDSRRLSVIITVLHRWIWITGLLGALLTLVLSPWLSELTFGNRDYTLAFIWLSVSLLFNQISAGQLVILQGLRKIKYLANANLTGAFLGLFVSVPFYYFWGIDGIVPAIIAISLANMLRSWYFARKVNLEKVRVSHQTTIAEGKQMLKMGFVLSMSGLLTTGSAYLLRIYISNTGSVDQVGLYSAGIAIINTYVGMVFTALGTDYYPRLSSVANDNVKASKTINQQAEITILLLAPILVIFIVFVNWAIILLYSTEFTDINGMIQWAALGMFFKGVSWSIAFILLAKGYAKLYFWNELIAIGYMLGINMIGYKFGGLTGIGIAFLTGYVLYLMQVYILCYWKYSFKFTKSTIIFFVVQFTLAIISFIITLTFKNSISYIFGGLTIILVVAFSFYEINKRVNISELLNRK